MTRWIPRYLALTLFVGCNTAPVLPPTPSTITFIATPVVSPGRESDTIIVQVMGELDRAVPNVPVTWSAKDPQAELTVVDEVTRHDGTSRAVLRAGPALDGQVVTVRVGDLDLSRHTLAVETGSLDQIGGGFDRYCGLTHSESVVCVSNGASEIIHDGPLTNLVEVDGSYCALTPVGRVTCFAKDGAGAHEIAGDYPPLMSLAEGTFFRIGTCGLDAAGQAWCWGHAGLRFMAPTQSDEIWEMPRPLPTTLRFRQLSLSSWTSCGVTVSYEVWCWGDNRWGQLGTGPGVGVEPRVVAGLPPSSIVHQNNRDGICALGRDRLIWCWGDSYYDGLGRNAPQIPNFNPIPQPVAVVRRAKALEPTGHGYAALDEDGTLFIWGFGIAGSGWRQGVPYSITPAARFATLFGGVDALACGQDVTGRTLCVDTGDAVSSVAFVPRPFRRFQGVP